LILFNINQLSYFLLFYNAIWVCTNNQSITEEAWVKEPFLMQNGKNPVNPQRLYRSAAFLLRKGGVNVGLVGAVVSHDYGLALRLFAS